MVKRVFLASLIVAAAFPAIGAPPADDPPELSDARVTIPYYEVKSLWAAAQRTQEKPAGSKPPVDATLVSARYQLALKDGQASGTAEFETQVFTDDWTVVPLLGTQAQIDSVEPADVQIITRDNYYALVTNKKGKQKIKIQFAAKLPPAADGARLRLPVAPASINTLTVTGIPEKQALQVADSTQVSADKQNATFRLAAQNHLDLDLVPEKTVVAAIPSRWKIEPQVFVQLADGKLVYEAHIAAHADNGSGLSMELEVPPDANVSNITGADLGDWRIQTADNQKHVAHIHWQTRDILRREIKVLYDLPQPLTAAEWKLQSPRILEGESSPPLYVLALEPGLELTPSSATPVPRQLPKWLADHAGETNTLVLVGEPPLQAKWLPLVQTLRAVVESARAKMQIVTDGAAITAMEYTVRHEAALGWKIHLPEGSELLASSVDDEPVNPINRGEHVIEFPLSAGKGANTVKLAYTAKGTAFNPVSGKIAIELPETDLLTNKLEWELRIPSAYEVAAFEGNVQPDAGSGDTDANSRIIRLRREIFKGERPSAELFYQKPEAGK